MNPSGPVEKDERVDWSGVDEKIALKILQQGEIYLKAQLDVALASDRRAISVGAVFSTVATALGGGTIALFQRYDSASLLFTGLCVAGWLALAGYFFFQAAWPTQFHIPGNHPSRWVPFLKGDFVVLVGREAEGYQDRIEKNDQCLKRSAEHLYRGARFVAGTPVVLLIVWSLSLYLFPS